MMLSCTCGEVRFEVEGAPILACDCCCASCREAAARLYRSGPAPWITAAGATPFVLYRKDRVRLLGGAAQLGEHRLQPTATTRRVLARCCGAPLFLEFEQGHWLSLYASLWPVASRPRAALRTMVADLPEPERLAQDIPNHARHSAGFMWRLFSAWAAMGFRSPAPIPAEAIHAE